jgi:hypothetical protein
VTSILSHHCRPRGEMRLWDFPTGSTGRVHGYGHYDDTYVKLDAGWRIAPTQRVRLRADVAGAETETTAGSSADAP